MEKEVTLGSIACVLGDEQRLIKDIEGFEKISKEQGIDKSFTSFGVESFYAMTAPIENYIIRAVQETLQKSQLEPEEVNYVIFSTTDDNLPWFNKDTAYNILLELGLNRCLPLVISLQQCASSLAAVDTAKSLIQNNDVNNVILVTFDFVAEDQQRIRSFAVFGDAVVSCLLSAKHKGLVRLLSYSSAVDFEGIAGRDDFESRKQACDSVYTSLQEAENLSKDDIDIFFSTNTYQPIALFNASLSRIKRDKLNINTLGEVSHCGNCDWIINFERYARTQGLKSGQKLAFQAFAPGFFACYLAECVEDAG